MLVEGQRASFLVREGDVEMGTGLSGPWLLCSFITYNLDYTSFRSVP